MRHVDQYTLNFPKAATFMGQLREGDEQFERFVSLHPSGHDNGYVYTTVPHEDGECSKYAAGDWIEIPVRDTVGRPTP